MATWPQSGPEWASEIARGLGRSREELRSDLEEGRFPDDRLVSWIRESYGEGFHPDFAPALLRNRRGLAAWAFGDGPEPHWPGADDGAGQSQSAMSAPATRTSADLESSIVNKKSGVSVMVLAAVVLAAAFAASLSRAPQPAEPIASKRAQARLAQTQPTTFPTESDPVAESRVAAESLVEDNPEEAAPSILDTIEEYLEDEDAYVREMGATALLRIAGMEAAQQSGLRDAALADSDLLDALYEAIGYYPTTDIHTDDEETRAMAVQALAVQALAVLYHDNPNPTVETALTDQYHEENSMWVRYVIVEALGQQQYMTTATEDVFIDAKDDYDADLAAKADAYLGQLYELRGP